MSVTVGVMIDEVLGLLESWSLDEEQSTTLAADLAPGDLTLHVTSARGIATGITPGILEIDRELLYADGVSGNDVSLTPWGRGYKSTTAAFHSAGSRVVSQPTFPRQKTLDAMNQVLDRVYPRVWAVQELALTTKAIDIRYDLPDDADRVLTVQWLPPDGENYWRSVERWRMAPDTDRALDIADRMMPGRPLRVVYAAKPNEMDAEDDDFEAVTGLPRGLRDVIVYGAAASMTTSQELSRLQTSSIEQQNRSSLVAPSAALTSSRYLEQRFQTRLDEERKSLQQKYPPRYTGTWR